jgi:hypothetical protein
MTEQKKLLMNFLIFFIPMVEMVYEEIQSLCNFLFLKIEPANKVQIFFRKTCLQCVLNIIFHIVHCTNRNGMKQSFPCMYGHIYHGTIFFYFLEKCLKNFLCYPHCPLLRRILLITITPTIKVQILRSLPSLKALLIPYLPKNHITSSNHRNLPKTKLGRPFHGHQTGLRINTHMKFLYPKNMKYTAPLFSNMDVIKVYN